MPYKQAPSFKSVDLRRLEIKNPAIGGLNLKDLDYEQNNNQSPNMKNMMYRNGAFSKRYGQEIYHTYDDEIYGIISFNDDIYVHSGTKVYKHATTPVEIATGLAEQKGLFFIFGQKLYYICNGNFYNYYYDDTTSSWVWGAVDPYVPDVLINCKPDGSHSDTVDDYNIVNLYYKLSYNGDGSTTLYKLYATDYLDTTETPVVEIDGTTTTAFTFNAEDKTITFTTAPSTGTNNVVIKLKLLSTALASDRARIFNSKFYESFGGNNNSRIFLAGGGDSRYYYSEAYDASYFPESNFAVLGNSEEDISGFGLQYNVLIVFKPREIYSLYSYTQNSSTTIVEEEYGLEAFKAQLVNPRIGCDAPYSIQLINNQLTWFNSNYGICCLVSTNIVDERNVRVISRNIERSSKSGIKGLLDIEEDLLKIQSSDFNNRYFLVFPTEGICYMWDYEICPYYYTASKETDVKILCYFLFDNFYVDKFLKIGKELLYVSSEEEGVIVKLNDGFNDFGDAIDAYYQTPLFQFDAVEYLKTVKNVYIQCRADTASVINIKYITEETPDGEEDPEPIRIGGRLWNDFSWERFSWLIVNFSNTFRRKCSLKKIQMAGVLFSNNEDERDMSISHLTFEYQIVKTIK